MNVLKSTPCIQRDYLFLPGVDTVGDLLLCDRFHGAAHSGGLSEAQWHLPCQSGLALYVKEEVTAIPRFLLSKLGL